jgi:hypothetical protein
VVMMSMLAVLVSAATPIASTAVIWFARFTALREVALEIFQAHVRCCWWKNWDCRKALCRCLLELS